MVAAVDVVPYTFENLRRLLLQGDHISSAVLDDKPHIAYFRTYFDKLGPSSIVVEGDYIDRDYMDDYANYYARCFADYPRRCMRLHFFCHAFGLADFRALL